MRALLLQLGEPGCVCHSVFSLRAGAITVLTVTLQVSAFASGIRHQGPIKFLAAYDRAIPYFIGPC